MNYSDLGAWDIATEQAEFKRLVYAKGRRPNRLKGICNNFLTEYEKANNLLLFF